MIKKISNDPLYHTSISMNGSIRIPNTNCEKRWFVFNKDSVDINYPSTIYGVFYTNCLTKIIKNEYDQPREFSLEQNYPNPFNPVTHLEFGISDLEFVSLKVYDVLGNEIKTLVNEIKSPGVYKVEFDGSNLSSGIYYYKLTAGEFSEVKKMTLLK